MTPERLAEQDIALVDGVLARRPRALAKAITLVESARRDHQARAEQVLAALNLCASLMRRSRMKLVTCGIVIAILFCASPNTFAVQTVSDEEYRNLLERLNEVVAAVTHSASKSDRAKLAVEHELDNWQKGFGRNCSANSANNECFDRANQWRMQLQDYIIDDGLLSGAEEHLLNSDKWLNHIYGVLIRKLQKNQRAELRQSQREWLTQRDSECKEQGEWFQASRNRLRQRKSELKEIGKEEKDSPRNNPLSGKPLDLWNSLSCIAVRNDLRSIQLDTMLSDNEPRKARFNKHEIEGGFVERKRSTYDVTANVPEVFPAEDSVTISYEAELAKYKIAISTIGGNLHTCEGEAFFVRKGNALLIDTSKASLKTLAEKSYGKEALKKAAGCKMRVSVLPHTLLFESDESENCSFWFGCGMRASLPLFVRRGTISNQ